MLFVVRIQFFSLINVVYEGRIQTPTNCMNFFITDEAEAVSHAYNEYQQELLLV